MTMSEAPLKVGDRVKFVAASYDGDPWYGTVEAIDYYQRPVVGALVRFDRHMVQCMFYPYSNLEKVPQMNLGADEYADIICAQEAYDACKL